MKKIFVLSGSHGDWDSFYTYTITIGIFDSEELAEAEKKRIVKNLTDIKNKYSPDEIEFLEKLHQENMFFEEREILEIKHPDLHKRLEEYLDWPFKYKSDSPNIDSISIKEHPLNITTYKYDWENEETN